MLQDELKCKQVYVRPGKQDIKQDLAIFGNYIKFGSFNNCLFKELCKDMFSTHEVLLFRASVRWLLKGNFLNHVCEVKDEIKFFSELKAIEFLSYFSDEICLKCLDYLAEMFQKLNNISLKV